MAARVLVPDPVAQVGLDLLGSHPGIELAYSPGLADEDFVEEMAIAEGVLLRTRVLTPELLAGSPKLRLVSRHGVGFDNVDVPTMQKLGIGLAITAEAIAPSVAEHTLMLILSACRRLVMADGLVKDSRWAEKASVQGRDLMGAEVALVGFGRIGRAVALRLLAFGARVRVFDPALPAGAELPGNIRHCASLTEVLAGADIVSLHTPAQAGGPMIGQVELAAMARASILVNTARGGLVDDAAVLEALDSGQLDRYATDVFSVEPPPPDAVLPQHDQVIATPHNASMTVQGAARMAESAAQNLIDGLTGTLPQVMTVLPIKRAAVGP